MSAVPAREDLSISTAAFSSDQKVVKFHYHTNHLHPTVTCMHATNPQPKLVVNIQFNDYIGACGNCLLCAHGYRCALERGLACQRVIYTQTASGSSYRLDDEIIPAVCSEHLRYCVSDCLCCNKMVVREYISVLKFTLPMRYEARKCVDMLADDYVFQPAVGHVTLDELYSRYHLYF